MEIRRKIVELYIKTQKLISLSELASNIGIAESEVKGKLSEEEKLDNFYGLNPEQASHLINYYGKGFLFKPDIEATLEQLQVVQQKIKEIENRS